LLPYSITRFTGTSFLKPLCCSLAFPQNRKTVTPDTITPAWFERSRRRSPASTGRETDFSSGKAQDSRNAVFLFSTAPVLNRKLPASKPRYGSLTRGEDVLPIPGGPTRRLTGSHCLPATAPAPAASREGLDKKEIKSSRPRVDCKYEFRRRQAKACSAICQGDMRAPGQIFLR
jgi:hypothetical protein